MAEIPSSAKRRAAVLRRPEERAQYKQRDIRAVVEIAFPVPPSTNKLFYNIASGGRGKTRAYRAWRQTAVLVASLPGGEPRRVPGRIAGLCRVAITLPPGRADGDNLVKPCLDAAVEVGVIADDGPKFIAGHSVERDPNATAVRMVFTAIPVDPMDEAEILARTREGHPISLIVAALGVTAGQVETVQAAALGKVHDILREAKAGARPADLAIAYGMTVDDVRAIIVRGRP